ncbi:MAG: hypothetical protein M1823_000702 [Watsoniomyces obsoletus]|nr:MAG: hypothetical protein M1823_000702 [Watsoniomyces obsoletus]
MGSSTSKENPQGSQHVFSSTTPVRFSQEMLNSLQSSGETDSTRAKSLEARIQARVADELRRLEERESQRIRELEEQISSSSSSSSGQQTSNSTSSVGSENNKQQEGQGNRQVELGREPIQREIEALRQKLQGRKKVRELDGEVVHAREEVIQCLQSHQQRPLDCWREVEAFKKHVARLEGEFVNRIL